MIHSKITISGAICTGKSTLLKNLKKKLGWKTFQTGKFFRQYVKDNGLDLETAEEQNDIITKKIDSKVADMLKNPGHLIVDGWMSGICAKNNKKVLRILLICKDDIRYKRFSKREKIPYDVSSKMVEQRQMEWFKKIEDIHKIKAERLYRSSNYDVVIDTSYITPQAVSRKVLAHI